MKPHFAITTATRKHRLGIMACAAEGEPPFAESRFFARLCEIGRSLGLPVFVFAPEWADAVSGTVTGYRYAGTDEGWLRETFPLPDLIYDRSFYRCPEQYRRHRAALRRLLDARPIPFLGRGLGGKLDVWSALRQYAEYRPHLPETFVYRGSEQLLRWLRLHGDAVLKPSGGSHGKGVLRVSRGEPGYRIQGRGPRNERLELAYDEPLPFLQRIGRLTAGRSYLLQPYLTLTTSQGDSFDIRSLVQKNEAGRWSVTGMAVRRGPQGSLTSNLHGGGEAEPLRPFLESEFEAGAVARIEADLLRLSRAIPLTLERHFGRLVELGIDLGVDRDGRVWVIEVNSKPGRAAFAAGTAGPLAEKRSLSNPIEYARFLLHRAR